MSKVFDLSHVYIQHEMLCERRYRDADCNPVSYVANLQALLNEFNVNDIDHKRRVIETADAMGVELKKVLKCW